MFGYLDTHRIVSVHNSNIGTFKHRHYSYGHSYSQCLNVPLFDPSIQTSAAEGRQGKSFSGCRVADKYVRLYAPPNYQC